MAVLAGDAPAILTPEDQYLFADRTVLVYDDNVDVDEDLENWIGNGQAPATAPAICPLMRIKDLKDWINTSQSAPISPAPRRCCSSRSPTPTASHRSPSRGRSPTPRTLTNGPHTPASPRARLPTPAAAERTPSRGCSPTPRTTTPRTTTPRTPARALRSPSPKRPRSKLSACALTLSISTPHPHAPPRSPPKPLSSSSSCSLVLAQRDLARGDQPRRSVEDEDEEDFEREIQRGELDDDEEPGPSTSNKGSKNKAAPGAKQKRGSTTAEKGKETGKDKGKGKAKKPHDTDTDNSDDDDGAAARRAAKGKAKAREKAKVKKASPLADDDEDDDDGGEGDDSESKSKSGAVSEEIRQHLTQLNDKYEADVAAIAREIGKPVTLLHQILRDLIKTPRALSAWNVWQRWFSESHPNDEHLGSTAYTDKSRAAFLQALHDVEGYPDFEDEKPPTTKESFERLPWLLEWDHNLTEQVVLMFREDGKLKPKLKKELVPVLQIAEKLRKTFGVQLWGFVIYPKGDASFMWGSGHDFKEMRVTHLISLTDICKNQEHIFGSIDLRKRGLAPQALPAIEEAAGSGGKRDQYRSQLGTILGSQLWGYCKANGTLTGHDVDPSKYQMKWSTKFVDAAFENQVRLINHPAALKDAGQIIGTGGFKLKDITVPLFDVFMPDLLIANRPRDPDDMELDNEVMKIVRWMDGKGLATRRSTRHSPRGRARQRRAALRQIEQRVQPPYGGDEAEGHEGSAESSEEGGQKSGQIEESMTPSRLPLPVRCRRSALPLILFSLCLTSDSTSLSIALALASASLSIALPLTAPTSLTPRTRTPERAAPRAGPSQKPHKSSHADDREGGPRLEFTHVGKGGALTVVLQDGRDRSGKHKAAEREAPRRHKDNDRVHSTKCKAADNGEGDDHFKVGLWVAWKGAAVEEKVADNAATHREELPFVVDNGHNIVADNATPRRGGVAWQASARAHINSLPYTMGRTRTSRTPLSLEGTPVGIMNRLAAESRTKTRYDINAVDCDAPRMAYAYTADELEAHSQNCGGPPIGTLCLSCRLPIPQWGCVNMSSRLYVPAMRPAPHGEVRLLCPKNHQELTTELEELEEKRCREADAALALHGFTTAAYTEACIIWVDVLASSVDLSRTRVADFRMPQRSPLPSPPIAIRPAYVRPVRVFAPKIPAGYDFAAAAHQRAQRANVGADAGDTN
ncbi:hypothetical protein DFH06DRAFT_1130436 [Mycena polygramma]|nr:hypothetical protein DFH06DRAFT_1130436 [Mycena polygramma]